jgi:DNA-binding XRE family transcriptional regulator
MKKIELGLNFSEIRKRIEIDMSQFKAGVWAKKIGVKTNSISNIHGKKGKANPSLEYVVAVARITGKPIEWYLDGDKAALSIHEQRTHCRKDLCKFCGDMTEDIKALCERVKNIMESGHRSAVPALLSNITAFEDSVEQAEDLRKLKETVRHLEKLSSSDQHTGTTRAAGAGMRKKKM